MKRMRALILPGLDGTGELLTGFLDALAPEIVAAVVRYPTEEAIGYAGLVEHVARLLPAGKVLLIAESFSGPVGIALAARFPDRIEGLCLCASFASSPRPAFKPMRSILKLPLPSPPIGLLGRLMLGRWSSREWIDRTRAATRAVRPGVARHRLAEVLAVDVSEQLEAIRCPILYVQASEDRLVPESAWRRIRAAVPHARCDVIEGPHFLLQVSAEAAAAAIKRAFVAA